MTFYVQKRLALGPIRFGVSARRPVTVIDDDPSFSTGPRGEFLRKHLAGFFFADVVRATGAAVLPPVRGIASTPFLDSLKPDGTRRGWGFLALMAGGLFFVLLGIAVLVRKGAAGWVEILLGLAMIATPIALTAQRRKQLRDQEERERAEREALEARNRKMLADYSAALERIHTDRSDAALTVLERERTALTLPYEIWSAAARDAITRIGFEELAKNGPAAARFLDRAPSAAGLTPEDTAALKHDIYSTFLWHLLADDRLGPAQEGTLTTLREALGIPSSAEDTYVEQFRQLPALDAKRLPAIDCTLPLTFRETCIHHSDGLTVTNKRLVVEGKKPVEVDLPQIDEISVDADTAEVVVRSAQKSLRVKVPDPIYTAAVLDVVSALDTRPKGFA